MIREPSTEQTALGIMTTKGIDTDLRFSKGETAVLQDLAKQVAELAARPLEKEKAELWTRLNDLEPVRPLVFCDPENGWNEIITQDMLRCEDKLARVWEMNLRKEIFWGSEMRDDRVIEPYFNVPYYYEDTGWGLVQEIIGEEGQIHGGSVRWNAPIEDYDRDMPKLKYPEIIVDYEQTEKMVRLAEEIFGGILTVRLRGTWWWTLGMTMEFIYLRGLENLMLDMYDNPDGVHRLMSFLRDGQLKKLDFLEEKGLLSLNTEGTYVGSGGFGWTKELPKPEFDPGHVRTMDMWGFTDSQETVGVSTGMFGEFIFPYQVPILKRFGLNCYGCCEPIDPRWEVVKQAPRLRRVSASPWANRAKMAEYLGNNYVMSMKPSPTPIAGPVIDQESIRRALREDLRTVKGCQVEIIMKDNHTIGRNPRNVIDWTRIAKEEAMNL
jgi:hypothetical protein